MTHESSVLSYSPQSAIRAREELFNRLQHYPATPEETERSLGLFVRGSLLARMLAVAELYQRITTLPGVVMDIGTWRGQTAVLCENLRAIYEPLNFTRRIFAFDTFEGYAGFGEKDQPSDLHRDGSYATGGDYAGYLRELLLLHEQSNAMGHNHGKHQVIAGDCRQTIPDFFAQQTHECVALAFFDLNAHAPTKEAFEAVYARMVPGAIAAFWQLTRSATPAEGQVYVQEILGKKPHRMHRAAIYPGLCYLEKC